MNWTIFRFKTRITSDIPYKNLITSIRGKSFNSRSSFRLNKTGNNRTRIFYLYRKGLDQRVGYYGGLPAEIIIRDDAKDGKLNIIFQYPLSVLIGLGLLIFFIIVFNLYIYPKLGPLWTSVLILTIYIGYVVELTSQLNYFIADLKQIEKSYKQQVDNVE